MSVMMEVIEVTAKKREESLQDAPLSLAAFSGVGPEARGIDNISEAVIITRNFSHNNNPVVGGSSSVISPPYF